MSKEIARKPESYENEALPLALLPALLEQHGFSAVATSRTQAMTFVDAKVADGSAVRFWLRQGWTDERNYSAIQFALFKEPGAAAFPDSHFIEFGEARVASAKAKGATYALLVHVNDGDIDNYVAPEIDAVAVAYRQQIAHWPKRARNTKTATLWFEDSRRNPDSDAATTVTRSSATAAVPRAAPGPVVSSRFQVSGTPTGSLHSFRTPGPVHLSCFQVPTGPMEAGGRRTSALAEGAPGTPTAEATRSPGMPPGRSSCPPCAAGRFEPADATLPGHLPHGVARAFRYPPSFAVTSLSSDIENCPLTTFRMDPLGLMISLQRRARRLPSPDRPRPPRLTLYAAVPRHTSRTPRSATLLVLSGTRCPGRGARQLHIRCPAPILDR